MHNVATTVTYIITTVITLLCRRDQDNAWSTTTTLSQHWQLQHRN